MPLSRASHQELGKSCFSLPISPDLPVLDYTPMLNDPRISDKNSFQGMIYWLCQTGIDAQESTFTDVNSPKMVDIEMHDIDFGAP